MPEPRWHASLGYALTGVEFALVEPAVPDPALLVGELAALGWTSDRVRAHAVELTAAEQPWPHAVPARLREGCGAAQLGAALGSARALLGLVSLDTRPPSSRTALNADEQRLVREVPPHHGT